MSYQQVKRIVFFAVIMTFLNVAIYAAEPAEKIIISVDYVAKFNEIGKAAKDESLNAAPYYKKAFEKIVKQPKAISTEDLKAWPTELSEEKQKLLRDWLEANSEPLEQIRLGCEKDYYWPGYEGQSMRDIALPELAQVRIAAKALCWRTKLKVIAGDYEAAFSDLAVCYQLGIHQLGKKPLIGQLVGTGIIQLALEVSFEILERKGTDDRLLTNLHTGFEESLAEDCPDIDFTFDRFFIHDYIQQIFTDDGTGGGHIVKVRELITQLGEQEKFQWGQMERRQTTELTDKLMDYIQQVAKKTPAQLHNEGKDPSEIIDEMAKDNPFLRLLLPSYLEVITIFARSQTQNQALITTIAVIKYKIDKGDYPENLSELVTAGYLEQLPVDAFSDKPLAYEKMQDEFLLYSFGEDLDDDGGVYSLWGSGEEGGDQVFWPVKAKRENN